MLLDASYAIMPLLFVIPSKPKVDMPGLSALEHDNLSSTVYATLCDALIKGRFQPGDRLKIRDIADQLGTSVTPVRDAILRLAHDEAIVFRSPPDIRIPEIRKDRTSKFVRFDFGWNR